MVRKTFEINNESGLHARVAAQFVKTTSRFQSDIWIEKENQKINAKSIMGILSIGISPGEEFEIVIDGKDEIDAMEEIGKLLSSL